MFRAFCVFVILMFAGTPAQAEPTLQLSSHPGVFSPHEMVRYWLDEEGLAELAYALDKLDAEGQWWGSSAPISFGFTNATAWLRLDIASLEDHTDNLVLKLNSTAPDFVDLFYLTDDGHWHQKSSGTLTPFRTRDIPHNELIFEFPLLKDNTQTLILRVKEYSAMTVSITVMTDDFYINHTVNAPYSDALRFGALGMFVLVVIVLWLTSNRPIFLWFGLFIAGSLIYAVTANGYAAQFLWPENPIWNFRTTQASGVLAAGSSLFSLSLALALNGPNRIYRSVLRIAGLLALTLSVIMYTGPLWIIQPLALLTTISASVVAATCCLLTFSAQTKLVKCVIISSLIFISGLVIDINLAVSTGLPARFGFHNDTVLLITSAFFVFSAIWIYFRNALNEKFRTYQERLNTQVKMAQELEATEAVKDAFIKTVAREFPEPINNISALSQKLISDLGPGASKTQQVTAEVLTISSEQLSKAVKCISRFDNLVSGKIDATLQVIDLVILCKRAAEMARHDFPEKSTQIIESYPAERMIVEADPELMSVAIKSLLDNACQVTIYGIVLFEILTTAQGVRVRIKDAGPGLSAGQMNRICQRFYRSSHTEAAPYAGNGLGLGLATTDKILALHKTQLSLRSQIGQGAEFSFVLPASDKQLTSESPDYMLNSTKQSVVRSPETTPTDVSEGVSDVRRETVQLMQKCVLYWRNATGGDEVSLALASGLWAVSNESNRQRARALRRYLNLDTLPTRPRHKLVIKTAYFVLSRLRDSNMNDSLQKLEMSVNRYQLLVR